MGLVPMEEIGGEKMFSVTSVETIPMPPHGTLIVIECPVESERDKDSMFQTIGTSIEIDGTIHKIKGIERSLILSPIQVGETIGVLVANNA